MRVISKPIIADEQVAAEEWHFEEEEQSTKVVRLICQKRER